MQDNIPIYLALVSQQKLVCILFGVDCSISAMQSTYNLLWNDYMCCEWSAMLQINILSQQQLRKGLLQTKPYELVYISLIILFQIYGNA